MVNKQNTRFSMKEFKPLTIEQKILIIEAEIFELQEKRNPFVDRKTEIELELSELNNQVRMNNNIPDEDFVKICKRQNELKAEKNLMDKSLLGTKSELRLKNKERDELKALLKYSPKEHIEERLVELRDKYTQFASDKSRVASMRAMAAEFVGEITKILK